MIFVSKYGSMLLSKVIDNNDIKSLKQYNINKSHFIAATDRAALKFIEDYAERNRGQAPSYAAVVEAIPAFTYLPAVEDPYEYLTKQMFNESADDELSSFISDGGLEKLYKEKRKDMPGLMDDIIDKVLEIKKRTDIQSKFGTDIKRDVTKFKDEYLKRKAGDSLTSWDSKYRSIGKYASGNLYVFFGKSGRGKSIITLADALHVAKQGANVLLWGMEMSYYEIVARVYTLLSGDYGVSTLPMDGGTIDAGFEADGVRNGTLDDVTEAAMFAFIDGLNKTLPGNLIIRAADDDDFMDRSLKQLESDIIQTEADVVLVDAFYHLDYEANTSKTAGGDAAETSKLLRRLSGTTGVAILALTQADEGVDEIDDDGERELSLPRRGEVKKTKQLLEDAYQLISIDTDYRQGRGLVGVGKGRNGGEGDITEIIYLPQFGVVRGLLMGEASINDFKEF